MIVGHVEVEVTLNRAHKLTSRIVDQIAVKLTEIRQICMPIHINSVNVKSDLKLRDDELKRKVEEYNYLIGDLCNLKIAIGEANSKVGVDAILTGKAMLNNELNLYTSIKSGLDRSDFEGTLEDAKDLINEKVSILESKGPGYGTVPILSVSPISKESQFSLDKIEDLIAGCKREQYRMDDQLSNLNATKIRVELATYTHSVLYS